MKFNKTWVFGIRWNLLLLLLMQAISPFGLSKMNFSKIPVSAQPRGYDDTTSCINEFAGTALHCRESACVQLEAEQGGANVNTEIEVFCRNRPILGAVVAERVYHHFARHSAQDISILSKSDAAYAVSKFMLRRFDSNRSFKGG